MEIRALLPTDERSAFSSENADIDRFVHIYAGQNQFKHYLGVTYVAVENGTIYGFATVAPGNIEVDGLPGDIQRKLPRYPLPVLRLARLAVDRRFRGRGIGTRLLRFVLRLTLRMAEDYGCVGLVIDAKSESVGFYSQIGFIRLATVAGHSPTRTESVPLFLSTRAIQAAST